MKKKTLWFLAFVLTLVALASLGLAWYAVQPRESLQFAEDAAYRRWVGQAVALKFTANDGREVNLAQLKGKVVLLDFWATWSGPCREATPRIKAAYEKFSRRGFEVVGVSFDSDKAALETFIADRGLPWPQHFDGTGRDNMVGRRFGIDHFPSLWLVDKEGVVRFISAGRDLEEKVEALLADRPLARNPVAQFFERLGVQPAVIARQQVKLANTGQRLSSWLPVTEARAKNHTKASRASASPKAFEEITLKGIIGSDSRGSALISAAGRTHSVTAGEEFSVATSEGPVTMRCEAIRAHAVVLTIPALSARRELALR